jgi:hypothetical protein
MVNDISSAATEPSTKSDPIHHATEILRIVTFDEQFAGIPNRQKSQLRMTKIQESEF